MMEVFGKERDYIVHNADFIKGFFGEYRWLSNFHQCEIYFDGMMFPSTENAYVYAKMPINIKSATTKEITEKLKTCSPVEAKKLGQTNPIREEWDRIKFDVMSSIVFDKFYRHIELREKLLETKNKYLEETNHWNDRVWGVYDEKGENNLGKILMKIRTFWYDPKKNYDKITTLF